jgi:hypothetical protein
VAHTQFRHTRHKSSKIYRLRGTTFSPWTTPDPGKSATFRPSRRPELSKMGLMVTWRSGRRTSPRHGGMIEPTRPVDNAARCPQGPTTATMIQFAEVSGHN